MRSSREKSFVMQIRINFFRVSTRLLLSKAHKAPRLVLKYTDFCSMISWNCRKLETDRGIEKKTQREFD